MGSWGWEKGGLELFIGIKKKEKHPVGEREKWKREGQWEGKMMGS